MRWPDHEARLVSATRFPNSADRYLLAHMLPRMAIALVVTLAALLIERLLRLLDFITGHLSLIHI